MKLVFLKKQVLFFFACFLIFLGYSESFLFCAGKKNKSAESKRVPDFNLTDLSDHLISSKDLRGKKLIIHFWAPSCFVCPDEVKTLNKLSQKIKGEQISIISILTFDTSERSLKAAKAMNLKIPVAIDLNGKIAEKYNVKVLPTTFLIDENGEFFEIKDPNELSKSDSRFDGPRDWVSQSALISLKEHGISFQ